MPAYYGLIEHLRIQVFKYKNGLNKFVNNW